MTIYTDANGRKFTYGEYSKKIYLDEKRPHVDNLVRHKWPEEKPEETGRYLALIEREYNNFMTILEWHGGEWFRYTYEKEIFVRENDVTHWWHLPEVE